VIEGEAIARLRETAALIDQGQDVYRERFRAPKR